MTAISAGARPRHRTEVINGIRQHYVTAGRGEPLLLVHGFPETHYAWRKVIPALARHFFVIAPDLRGCGDTERPDTPFDKKIVAEDLHALVGHLGLGAINLAGHDVGMMVAYEYAATHRDTVRRAVFMEAALPGLGLEALYDGHQHPRMYHLGLFAYFRSHRRDAERNREHARTALTMPVLAVAGEASAGADLEGQIAPLAEYLRFEVLAGCGHYLAEEQPERLTALLLDFLTTPAA